MNLFKRKQQKEETVEVVEKDLYAAYPYKRYSSMAISEKLPDDTYKVTMRYTASISFDGKTWENRSIVAMVYDNNPVSGLLKADSVLRKALEDHNSDLFSIKDAEVYITEETKDGTTVVKPTTTDTGNTNTTS